MRPIRNIKRWKRRVFWYGVLDNFLSTDRLESGIHTSQLGNLFYDIMIENNNADTTIFCFNAAMGKELKEFPVFTGNSMLAGEKVNRVFINDPSLYVDNKLKIAWYSGILNGFNVQENLLKIIEHIIKLTNTKKKIFYGASAGGYAALYYSWFFKDALAVVVNPQTNLYRYNRIAVSSFAKAVLGANTDIDVEKSLSKICSRLDVLYSLGSSNHIFYIQNKTDHHVNDHLKPFLENLRNKDKIRVILGNWGQGHKAPPPDFSRILLKHIFQFDKWDDAINSKLPKEIYAFELDKVI